MSTSSALGRETTPVLLQCERKPASPSRTHRKHLEPSALSREKDVDKLSPVPW